MLYVNVINPFLKFLIDQCLPAVLQGLSSSDHLGRLGLNNSDLLDLPDLNNNDPLDHLGVLKINHPRLPLHTK